MFIIIYFVLSYLAINKVWYSRHEYLIFDSYQFFLKKAFFALFLGWILIPIALIMLILRK